ncbi:hypothetical protein SDJN03_26775, partial [Cucurbita argyrosperma subsp. sororia]
MINGKTLSLSNVIKRYQSHLEGRNENLVDNDTKDHESDETILVEEPNFKKLNAIDLLQLENQLQATLHKIKYQRSSISYSCVTPAKSVQTLLDTLLCCLICCPTQPSEPLRPEVYMVIPPGNLSFVT